MKKKLAVMFSGGRTSAYMCYWLIKNKSDEFDMTFVYANTGQEHPNTLKFVDQVDKSFNLGLYWIEADVKTKGVGTSYKMINYDDASLTGEPFEDMVKKFGLPNKDFPHCTRELKIEPFKKFAKDYIGDDYKQALGVRSDEMRRVTKNELNYYPLAIDHPVDKEFILSWWRKQPFDLELPEHLGNCTWCWKKSDRKLQTLAVDHPEIFEFPRMLESKYSKTSNYERKDERQMFRKYKTVDDIFLLAKEGFDKFVDPKLQQAFDFEECAEECGSVWMQDAVPK
jgi:hypothetical protein